MKIVSLLVGVARSLSSRNMLNDPVESLVVIDFSDAVAAAAVTILTGLSKLYPLLAPAKVKRFAECVIVTSLALKLITPPEEKLSVAKVGMSALTSARKVGAALGPVVGPA